MFYSWAASEEVTSHSVLQAEESGIRLLTDSGRPPRVNQFNANNNGSYHLLRVITPDTHVLSHWTHTTAPRGKNYCYPYFKYEESGDSKPWNDLCGVSLSKKVAECGSKLGHATPG